jgi:hypothetical protein
MATTSGTGLSGCGPVAGGLRLEANKMAEIDVRARARAIRSAKARVEFFSFFFILFGGLESLDQMASVPGLPPAIQELVELLGGVFR